MKLFTIDTGFFKLDGGAMFGVVPKSIWQRSNPADENNLCTWATRLLLIQESNELILIDTGIGNKQDENFFRHYYRHGDASLESSLRRHGFSVEDVTQVILTHLHFDHVGGAVIRQNDVLLPTFPNANYWTNDRHWNWAIHPNPRERASFLKENILPLHEHGKLHHVPEDGHVPFSENIRMRFVHGHTEAMMLPQINYHGRTLLYMADLLPSVGHIPIPYVMGYDIRPLETMQERQAFWQEAVDGHYTLFLEHDPTYECCTLKLTEKGIRLDKTLTLEAFCQGA